MHHHVSLIRLGVMLTVILLVFGAVSWRLFDLAVVRHAAYRETARAQAVGSGNILLRGNIYLTDGTGEYLVATNRKYPVLQVTPSQFTPPDRPEAIATLVHATGLSPEAIERALASSTSGSRPLMRKLTDEQVAAVEALDIPGIAIRYETDRSYPAGMLAADTIGFFGYTDEGRRGQYGVEASREEQLSGSVDISFTRWDIVGQLRRLFGLGREGDGDVVDPPHDVILTIDKNIQAYAQDVLEGVLKKYDAVSGVLIVQEPTTGRLLAVADSPSYDPNRYGSFPPETYRNGALIPFEPGSSFKPFTMAIGLDTDAITPTTTFDDIKDVIVDGYPIRNFNEGHFGRVTMTQVLEKSINTGVMDVLRRVGNETFLNYLIAMGFGQPTGIDLPGDANGSIANLYTGRPINFMTASFGQGITVTPLQLVTAYSAIANGGKFMRPYVVEAVRDDRGTVVHTQPQTVGTPFTAATAATLRSMLTSVVDNGFDKARIARYDVAGKTGTAQIASPKGGYLKDEYNHSFVGFAPAGNPRFVILIRMEKPRGITFAADSLSSAFRDMALFMLNYLNIPPTQ